MNLASLLTTLLNEHLLFVLQVHRTLMTITVLLTIAGIVVIFVHVKGWSSVSNEFSVNEETF